MSEQRDSSKKQPKGRPFQKGQSGNPAGRKPRGALVTLTQVSGSLTAAGHISIRLQAQQLQALWERSQERELTAEERGWASALCAGLREEVRVRGMVAVELLKIGRHDVQQLLQAFTGEEPRP